MRTSVKVYALGTGGAIQSARRDNTSLLVIMNGKCVLVDFPGSVCRKIEALGINSLSVRTALITHRHIDHIYGLPSFFHNHWLRLKNQIGIPKDLRNENYSLRMLIPQDALSTIEGLVSLFGFDVRPEMFPFELKVFSEGRSYIDLWDGWQIEVIPANHGGVVCFGFIFEHLHAGIRIAYSGDSEPTDTFLQAASGANLIIHDCETICKGPIGHSDAEALVQAISRYEPPKRFVPIHIEGIPEDPAQELLQILADVKSDIIIPEDGMLLLDLNE
ncbi:MAG TPA: MBL fold metallo-hydrolase [Smithella sp.]|nr:MBL fold metallo-hydrolase [Smithella sp.]